MIFDWWWWWCVFLWWLLADRLSWWISCLVPFSVSKFHEICPRKQEQQPHQKRLFFGHLPNKQTTNNSSKKPYASRLVIHSDCGTTIRSSHYALRHPFLNHKFKSQPRSARPSSPLRSLQDTFPRTYAIQVCYMYFTPYANDLKHQPPLELHSFRIQRKPCSNFSSNG